MSRYICPCMTEQILLKTNEITMIFIWQMRGIPVYSIVWIFIITQPLLPSQPVQRALKGWTKLKSYCILLTKSCLIRGCTIVIIYFILNDLNLISKLMSFIWKSFFMFVVRIKRKKLSVFVFETIVIASLYITAKSDRNRNETKKMIIKWSTLFCVVFIGKIKYHQHFYITSTPPNK